MIRIISTGGTIAESPGQLDRFHLSGDELVAKLGGDLGDIDSVDLMDIPSTFVTVREMLQIEYAVRAARNDPQVSGVVVTHGTATLEETAFLVDLVSVAGKPVVFTGALLTPDRVGYDGLMNLRDSIKTASCSDSYGKGVLVVMGGQIHSARDVVKGHATALDSFRSPEFGPIGRVDGGQPYFVRVPIPQQAISVQEPLANVQLVTCYAGIESDVFTAFLPLRPNGIVVQGMGSGTVPPWIADTLGAMAKDGVAVVLTTRCAEGRVITSVPPRRAVAGYPEDLYSRGVIPTNLPGLKARLKLLILLSARMSGSGLKQQMLT